MAFGLAGIIIGILMILVGFFLVFMFPTTTVHQGEKFGIVGIIMGIVLLMLGGALIFL